MAWLSIKKYMPKDILALLITGIYATFIILYFMFPLEHPEPIFTSLTMFETLVLKSYYDERREDNATTTEKRPSEETKNSK